MNAALQDTAIYANGRTYAEHCAWVESLRGDEWRIVHMPIGHLLNLAEVAYFKYALLKFRLTAAWQMKLLEGINSCAYGPVTAAAIEAIDPACDTAVQMLHELHKVPRGETARAFAAGGIFRLLSKLNPSLLTALRLCQLGPVPPEAP